MSEKIYSREPVFNNLSIYREKDNKESLSKVEFLEFFKKLQGNVNPTVLLYESLNNINCLEYLSEDFVEKESNKKSVVNFVRYLQQVSFFISKKRTIIDINNKGQVFLSFQCKNKSLTRLDLTFNENGKVDFISIDKEYDSREKKTFVLRGSIETSDMFSKSYKIQRLLMMLKYLDSYEDNFAKDFFKSSFSIQESNYSKKKHITTKEYLIKRL